MSKAAQKKLLLTRSPSFPSPPEPFLSSSVCLTLFFHLFFCVTLISVYFNRVFFFWNCFLAIAIALIVVFWPIFQQQIAILSFISSRKICSWKRRAGGSQLVSLTLLKELVILEYDCIIGVWLERNCPLSWCLVGYATLLSFIVVLVHW